MSYKNYEMRIADLEEEIDQQDVKIKQLESLLDESLKKNKKLQDNVDNLKWLVFNEEARKEFLEKSSK